MNTRIASLIGCALLVLVAAVVFVFPAADPTQAQVTSGLTGYWRFDEGSGTTAADDVGGATGSLMNGATWTSSGKVGSALVLDGVNDYVDAGDIAAAENTTAMTFSAWVYQTSASANRAIAAKWNFQTQGSWAFQTDNTVTSKLKVFLPATLTDGGGNAQAYTNSGAWTSGAWHHAAFVFDGTKTGNASRLKIYIDGVEQTLTFGGTVPSRILNSTAPLRFGMFGGTLTRYWNGRLDDVRIYNRALSASEIDALYNASTPVVDESPSPSEGSVTFTLEGTPLTGWAFSSTTGWISMNSNDSRTGTGGSGTSGVFYGVGISTTTQGSHIIGTFNGYGWSSNVGWVSFQPYDVVGCQDETPMSANLSTGVVTGWIRVLAGKAQDDGWDGCIKLSGTNFESDRSYNGLRGVTYHVSADGTTGSFKGYAWGGSAVQGWTSFINPFDPSLEATCEGGCGGGGGDLTPSLTLQVSSDGGANYSSSVTIPSGTNVLVRWVPENVASCEAQSGNWPGGLGDRDPFTGVESMAYTNSTTLTMTCLDSDSNPVSSDASISVAGIPGGSSINCVQPLHALMCNPAQSATAPSGSSPTILYPNQALCGAPFDPPYCEFYCETGYIQRGGICTKSSATEE